MLILPFLVLFNFTTKFQIFLIQIFLKFFILQIINKFFIFTKRKKSLKWLVKIY